MTTALYLEHYLDGLENLPQDLNSKFSEMRNLDTQSQTHLSSIKRISSRLDAEQYTIAATDRAVEIQKVDRMFGEAKRIADRKVVLAMETYECIKLSAQASQPINEESHLPDEVPEEDVDKHIRSLDADLLRFEMELKGISSRKETLQKINKGKAGRKRKESATGTPVNDENIGNQSTVGRKRKRKHNANIPILEESNEPSAPLLQRSIAEATDVLDMPVDPNEPTYCICNQVSYGEMIGCDNPDCPIEWFHFSCVTLPTKKQMKWYCPRCTILRKKK